VLEPVAPTFGAPQDELDRATMQDSYDEHLASLALVSPRHNVDHPTGQLVVDRHRGTLEVRGYEITNLARLLLRQLGIGVDEAQANIRMEPTRR
jgi:hypothetical protein